MRVWQAIGQTRILIMRVCGRPKTLFFFVFVSPISLSIFVDSRFPSIFVPNLTLRRLILLWSHHLHLHLPFSSSSAAAPSRGRVLAAIEKVGWLTVLLRRWVGLLPRNRRKFPDLVEKTSDYSPNVKKCWINKRKASDIDKTDPELDKIVLGDRLTPEVKIHSKDREVLIEMKCPYREYLLVDILEAINNLHLDEHSIQSSTLDGILSLALKSKVRGVTASPDGFVLDQLCQSSSSKQPLDSSLTEACLSCLIDLSPLKRGRKRGSERREEDKERKFAAN